MSQQTICAVCWNPYRLPHICGPRPTPTDPKEDSDGR